eukprot:12259289-Karenia_brevis.AAC.1
MDGGSTNLFNGVEAALSAPAGSRAPGMGSETPVLPKPREPFFTTKNLVVKPWVKIEPLWLG